MSEPPSARPPGGPPPNFQVAIRLEWVDDPEVPILYANQVLVSHGGPEFFVVFGVVVPPMNPNELPDSLAIQPQVRLVIAREAMPSIVQAMADNLRRYRDAGSPGGPGASPPAVEPGT